MASGRADEFRARYTVSLIGLPIGEAAAAGSIGPASYRIDLNAKLTGVAAMVANVKLALAATGALRRGGVAPSTMPRRLPIPKGAGRCACRSMPET